jgi:hypothetical protein
MLAGILCLTQKSLPGPFLARTFCFFGPTLLLDLRIRFVLLVRPSQT